MTYIAMENCPCTDDEDLPVTMVIFIATSNYQRVTWKTVGFSSSYIVCLKIAGWTILTVEIWVHHGIWL